MKTINATIRFTRNGEYDGSDNYSVEIPINTKEDDEVEVIMDAVRPILQDEFEGDEDWENGDMTWTLDTWE
jgi:hypothetical protein